MTNVPRKRYPSDLTDQQWEIIREVIPQPRKSRNGGRPRSVDMREVLNTILYQCRSGCQWDMLPHDLLPKSTVYDYFAKWRDDGTLAKINDRLVGAIRMLEARSEEIGWQKRGQVAEKGSGAEKGSVRSKGSGLFAGLYWGIDRADGRAGVALSVGFIGVMRSGHGLALRSRKPPNSSKPPPSQRGVTALI